MRRYALLGALPLLFALSPALAQTHAAAARSTWTAATAAQLESALPARAQVEKERIETEMTSASGVIDTRGRVIAAVVLITAGYAAQGKYSHFLLLQAPIRIGTEIVLTPGTYVVGWVRAADGLTVHLYQAETGRERGVILAHPQTQPLPVVPVKIWPPSERGVIQIGRFTLPYAPLD
ncbi:MAG: hypothetical protein M3O02_04555 [Acidobacteriota bacterium]|nr:hypothetical protein [Acidobacteriota bacterium]